MATRRDLAGSGETVTVDRSVAPVPTRLPLLQCLRGIAALSVVLFHVSLFFSLLRDYRTPAVWFGWRFGRFGVVLFFVISGALMAELAPRSDAVRFLTRRAVRVYPIYWLALIAAAALNWLEGARHRFDLRSFGLIPGRNWSYPLGVEWTLPFEMTFYVMVTALILVGAAFRLQLAAMLWIACIAAADLLDPQLQADWQFPTLFHLPLTDFSLGFACGLLMPWISRHGRLAAAAPIVGVGLILGSELYAPLTMWLLALGCTGLVSGAMRPRTSGITFTRPLATLGDWSFALYLCHVPVALAVLHYAPGGMPPILLWPATVAIVICAAGLFGPFDIAMHRVLRRSVDRANPALCYAIGAASAGAIIAGGIGVIRHWL